MGWVGRDGVRTAGAAGGAAPSGGTYKKGLLHLTLSVTLALKIEIIQQGNQANLN